MNSLRSLAYAVHLCDTYFKNPPTEKAKQQIIDTKRQYRQALKDYTKPNKYKYVRYEDLYATYRYEFKYDEFASLEEFTDCMVNEFWIESPNSPYDCTGRTFTFSIDCFELEDRWIAYVENTVDL